MATSTSATSADELPREVLERIFDFLSLESKLSAGLTCRRWLDILKGVFGNLTDISLVFEDDYCQYSSVVRVQRGSNSDHSGLKARKRQRSTFSEEECRSAMLTVNLCACPEHLHVHRHTFRNILITAGQYVKKLIVEDYLLQKDSFIDGGILEMFARRCPGLNTVELHHVDLSRKSEMELIEIFGSSRMTEISFKQCSWSSWTEIAMNRMLKSVVSRAMNLQEVHLTVCPLLNDRSLQYMAKTCLYLWYVDLTGCRSITAKGLAQFFYYMPHRRSDLLYIKICETRIDGNELQYFLFCDQRKDAAGSGSFFVPSTENGDRGWTACNFVMETGHRACSFQNRYVPGKSIVVFV